MLANLVKVAVPAPGTVDVGTVVALGAADTGFTTFHAAFGVGVPAFFYLSDGAGRTLIGTWVTGTGAGGVPVATVREIIWNTRTNSVASESFSGACTAWCELPAQRAVPFDRVSYPAPTEYAGSYAITGTGTYIVAANLAVPAGTRRIEVDASAVMVSGSAALCAAWVRPDLVGSDGVAVLQNGTGTYAFLAQATNGGAPAATLPIKSRFALTEPSAPGCSIRFSVYSTGSGAATLSRLVPAATFIRE